MNEISYKMLVFTGPIDEYFDYRFGKLPYRSLKFKFETYDQEVLQQTGTINSPNDYGFTRITEFKYLTGQQHSKTSLVYEFPMAEGDPYYLIPKPCNTELYDKYYALASGIKNTYFVGCLASYKYYNMDQVVAQALSTYKKISLEDHLIHSNGRQAKTLKTA